MGLLNNLSNHTKDLATLLDPLKHHICVARNTKKKVLVWSKEDSEYFKKCKYKVIELMEQKISYFEMGKPLALITDWSGVGSGFILNKKNMQMQS